MAKNITQSLEPTLAEQRETQLELFVDLCGVELEVRVDGCDGPTVATQPLPPMPAGKLTNTLPAVALPARPGRHDVCLRFARPKLDPMWALDWVEIRP